MMSEIVGSVGSLFSYCWLWMRSIFDATGAVPYYLAALVLFLATNAILIPLRGGRMFSLGSDVAGVARKFNKGD